MNETVRLARSEDAPALLEIYAYYVQETAISFEHQVPSLAEFRDRMDHIQSFYPYLVVEVDGKILGYAYAGPFRSAAAYAWAVESTIYLSPQEKGRGLGHLLYDRLETCLKAMGILSVKACIGLGQEGDPYSSVASQIFHAKRGYVQVAHFPQVGFKFQRWYDMIWMEKDLGPKDVTIEGPKAIWECKNLQELGLSEEVS
ncbi:GNAT family N-acetyltransferase [Streptococcus sp. NLN76]|uniref:GNAT family N-acetyltransferase n=1 Tax=Streptococcus sp. NLN76 TaxID=2822800 RepID=UPI0018A9CB0A|nr:GNAT family N-acetyltransferase [Streptococcus sp. NLN76]MBF8970496.1 N-acetyltransferase [Streptococcus sp. NLN76]